MFSQVQANWKLRNYEHLNKGLIFIFREVFFTFKKNKIRKLLDGINRMVLTGVATACLHYCEFPSPRRLSSLSLAIVADTEGYF